MLFKNRLEKLMFNNKYNIKHKGDKSGGRIYCIYNVPGEFYKTVYVAKGQSVMREYTAWLLVTKFETASMPPFVEVREAFLTGDESLWWCHETPIGRFFNSNELDVAIQQYKASRTNKIQRFK